MNYTFSRGFYEMFGNLPSAFLILDGNLVIFFNEHASNLFPGLKIGEDITPYIGEENIKRIQNTVERKKPYPVDNVLISCVSYTIDINYMGNYTMLSILPSDANQNAHLTELLEYNLKNPLNTILSSLTLLTKSADFPTDEKSTAYLSSIYHNNYKIQRLLNNFTDYCKLMDNNISFNPRTVDMVKFLEDISKRVSELYEYTGVNIEYETELDSLYCDIDPNLIERAIFNILSNSIKYTRKGNAVTIKLARKDTSVYITIKDRGTGIPSDVLSNVMMGVHPRLDLTNPQGLMLGLPLARHILKLHDGNLTISSEENQGTTVALSIPAKSTTVRFFDHTKPFEISSGLDTMLLEFADVLPSSLYLKNNKKKQV